ncbi:MAG TPA: hydroxymethylbilane synthase [Terriglobales bacterium]|nr:hydroxymethylbilane synthase [Terriglobales bacterium]
MATLRIGSRGSQLALWQANHVADQLRQRGHQVEIEVIHTTGDKVIEIPLVKVGTKGMFTKEIEQALVEGRVDLAVHSLKDLPTDLLPGFELAAITPREDPHDAFVSQKFNRFADLPKNARVGTSSLRREAQVRALRRDLEVRPLRGNVDTRLRKLQFSEYDAIILAAAGLRRLAHTGMLREIFSAEVMCPAAGQGALAIEVRAGDAAVREHLVFLDDPAARATTSCERALLRRLGGGCQVPIGALAEMRGKQLLLRAVVARPDGSRILREAQTGSDAEKLGDAVAQALLRAGADAILQEIYGLAAATPQQP